MVYNSFAQPDQTRYCRGCGKYNPGLARRRLCRECQEQENRIYGLRIHRK